MQNTSTPNAEKAQVAGNQQVNLENQTIESVLQPLKETFIVRWIEDMKEHRLDLVSRKALILEKENQRAFEIYKQEGTSSHHVDVRSSAFLEGRVESDSVLPADVSFNYANTRTARCQDDRLRTWLNGIDADKKDVQKKIDRIPTSAARLEKMALAAWLKRLDTLERGVERKGLDVDTARVQFFTVNGGDYDLQICDAEGRIAYARSILAGGFGTSVRLHLRFITT
jgi:hypothetical protein